MSLFQINFEDNTIELVNNLNSTDIENNEWILTEMENFKNVPVSPKSIL